jgi:hypothetical protein
VNPGFKDETGKSGGRKSLGGVEGSRTSKHLIGMMAVVRHRPFLNKLRCYSVRYTMMSRQVRRRLGGFVLRFVSIL